MARIKAEQNLNTMVNHKHFMRALKTQSKLAFKNGVYPMLHKAGLLEVSQKFQKISITTTDLSVGTTIELPCHSNRDASAVVDLSTESVHAVAGHAELLGKDTGLMFADLILLFGEKTTCGGIPFGEEGASPEDWPLDWTREGMTRESRSDAFVAENSDFFAAVRFAFPCVYPDERRVVLEHLHARRMAGDYWQMESTDGHRAAVCKLKGVLTRDLILHPAAVRAYLEINKMVGEDERVRLRTFNNDVDACNAGSFELRVPIKDDGAAYVVVRNSVYSWTTDSRIDGFPPLEKVTPAKTNCFTFAFSPKILESAAQTCIDLSKIKRSCNGGPFDHDHAVVIFCNEEDHEFYLQHKPSGRKLSIGHDSKWIAKVEPPTCEVLFNPFYILDAARALARASMATAWLDPDPKSCCPLMLEDGLGGMTLVMPIRI